MFRRIIYAQNEKNETVIISHEIRNKLDIISNIHHIDLDYEKDKDKFDRTKKMHIEDGQVIFDELYPKIETQEEKIVRLENELLMANGVI